MESSTSTTQRLLQDNVDVEAANPDGPESDSKQLAFYALESPYLRLSLLCLGVMPIKGGWSLGDRLYWFYRNFWVPLAVCIASPYVLYQHFWMGINMSLLSQIMFTCTACFDPVLSWLFLRRYIRSDHYSNTWLPLAKKLSKDDISKGKSIWDWHVIRTVGMTLFYWFWSFQILYYNEKLNEQERVVRFTMFIVCATFIYRAAMQSQLCFMFQMVMMAHRGAISRWFAKWSCEKEGDIRECVEEVERNVAARNDTESEWAQKFIVLCVIPCVIGTLMAYSVIFAPKDAKVVWLEIGYCCFNLWLLYLAVDAACDLSKNGKDVRYKMLIKFTKGEAKFKEGTTMLQENSFVHWLPGAFQGFRILGVEITKELRNGMVRAAVGLAFPVLYSAAKVFAGQWTSSSPPVV